MLAAHVARIFAGVRASGFRDLAGARASATIPLGERLLNEIISTALPQSAAVRDVTVHPQADNRIGVRVKLARPDFVPPFTVTLIIERQPVLPDMPLLVFRVTGLAGLLALAGPLLSLDRLFPAGVRLEGDRLTIDLAMLLAHYGQRELLGYLERLRVTSEAGRLVVELDARA